MGVNLRVTTQFGGESNAEKKPSTGQGGRRASISKNKDVAEGNVSTAPGTSANPTEEDWSRKGLLACIE